MLLHRGKMGRMNVGVCVYISRCVDEVGGVWLLMKF